MERREANRTAAAATAHTHTYMKVVSSHHCLSSVAWPLRLSAGDGGGGQGLRVSVHSTCSHVRHRNAFDTVSMDTQVERA